MIADRTLAQAAHWFSDKEVLIIADQDRWNQLRGIQIVREFDEAKDPAGAGILRFRFGAPDDKFAFGAAIALSLAADAANVAINYVLHPEVAQKLVQRIKNQEGKSERPPGRRFRYAEKRRRARHHLGARRKRLVGLQRLHRRQGRCQPRVMV
jgi:hypothetical protein